MCKLSNYAIFDRTGRNWITVNIKENPEGGRECVGGRWPLVVFSRKAEADEGKEKYVQGLDWECATKDTLVGLGSDLTGNLGMLKKEFHAISNGRKGKSIKAIEPLERSEATVKERPQSLENHIAIRPLFIEYIFHKIEIRKMKSFISKEIEIWLAAQQKFHLHSSI